MADYYWRGDSSGNGLWSVGNNWSSTATATTRYSVPPSAADRVLFQLNAYPAGAVCTLDISPTIANIIASTTAASISLIAPDTAVKQITLSGAAQTTLNPALSFPDDMKTIMFNFTTGTVLQLNGTTEQYKGLYAIQAAGSSGKEVTVSLDSTATTPPLLNYTRLQASGFSNGLGIINLNNKFNTIAGLQFTSNSRLINVLDGKIFISPLKSSLSSPYVGLSISAASGMGSYPYEVNFLSNSEFSILLNGNPVTELKIAAEKVRFTGVCTINGLLSLSNTSQLNLVNGANVRFTTADLNDGVVLRNLTDGGLSNFALGAARPEWEPDEVQYTVTGWDIKDVQSDSRNIGVENGTNSGNTEGFLFQGGPNPPLDESRTTTSTVGQILFGIVRTTKEKSTTATYKVEPINFTVETSSETNDTRTVTMSIGRILFSAVATAAPVQDEIREVIAFINPINLTVTARPQGMNKKYTAQIVVAAKLNAQHIIYLEGRN